MLIEPNWPSSGWNFSFDQIIPAMPWFITNRASLSIHTRPNWSKWTPRCTISLNTFLRHGQWFPPTFQCSRNFTLPRQWIVTYAVPFFGLDTLGINLEFKWVKRQVVSFGSLRMDRSVGVSCESMPIWVIWISINAQCRTTCRMHSKAAIVVTIKAQWYVSIAISVSSRLKIFVFSVSRFSVVAFDWVDTNVVVDLATNIRSSIKTTSSMVTRWTLNGIFWWVIIPACPVSINWNVVSPWPIRSNRWVLFFFYSLFLLQCPWIIESAYSTFSLSLFCCT